MTLFIDGLSSESSSTTEFDVINPANGKPLFSVPVGCEADVDRAVASARHAFVDQRWSQLPPSARKHRLMRFADLIAQNANELDSLDAVEMGKPVCEAFGNASATANLMRFCAETVDKIVGDVYSSDQKSFVSTRLVPRGVVAAIVPWNFPTYNAVLKLGPALAAGNTVVLKPSELASRSAAYLGHLAVEAGVPPGVLNVVPGLGETVGRALGLHGDVDMITFTGSSAVGKQMLRYSGESNMKIILAECGGKSPHIVFDDGLDMDEVGASVARLLLTNQGQLCSAGSRLLVQRSIEEALVAAIRSAMSKIVIGDPLNPVTTFGPLVSKEQRDRVLNYIQGAEDEGAILHHGGRTTLEDTGGYFVEPTIFRGVAPQSRIAREEIFGPVLSVIPFTDEEEAVAIANGTMYGLMAYVWTARLSTGLRVAKKVRSSVIVNAAVPQGEGPGHAFCHEPAGQSGVGIEGGVAGIGSYLRRQMLWFNHA